MTDPDSRLRWILWDEFTGDEDRAAGSCVEVDGLFVDLPVPVERFVLRGCVPGEPLREAIAGIGTERARLGTVLIEAEDDPGMDHLDNLYDVVVVAAEGDEVVLRGRIEEIRGYRPATEPPAAEGFRLRDAHDRALGHARTVEGLHRERPELAPPAVTLVGFRPEPWFRVELSTRGRPRLTATVLGRGAGGAQLSTYTDGLDGAVVAVRESAAGPGLIDVELDDGVFEPMPSAARPLWDRWLQAPPTEPGSWTILHPSLRHEWLRLALAQAHPRSADRPAGRTYRLDSRHVTDLNGFYCALGEAVNGPGGYFGWNLDALIDCLRGGWGARRPFRLEWSPTGGDWHEPVLRILAENGVEVGPAR
ncbi:barstar family protein [Actinoplanes siamensis]|uniref:barstar family protein n=1 Tax=Actinoplanes siamensis TaxID=1223317 RepID=UPI0019433FC5|nr:barstar family protein [Actinoplanes siamensis]